MGFSVNSRMLVYALYTVSCMSNETFTRKLELFEIPEEKFLANFIVKFRDDAEELLVAYKGRLLDSSSEDES
ncbi:hypothetical protein SLA2020_274390 [Shorea laevis]